MSETVAEMRSEIIDLMVSRRVPEKAFAEQWQLTELADDLQRLLNMDLPVVEWGHEEGIDETHLRERIRPRLDEMMAAKAANMTPELMRFIEKSLLIQVLDAVWKEHLYALDHLRQGIGLRAYGQRDPLNEYKSEAFVLFNAMLDELKERVTSMLARVELAPEGPAAPPPPRPMQMFETHPEPEMVGAGGGRLGDGVGDAVRADADAGCRADDARRYGGSERSGDLAQRVAQRAVPVRVGEEIQALPWQVDVVGGRGRAGRARPVIRAGSAPPARPRVRAGRRCVCRGGRWWVPS